MAWVTWRQHRQQLVAAAGLIALVAIAALATDLPIRAAYHRQTLSSCLPPATRSGCDIIVSHFRSEFGARMSVVRYLMLLPALLGLFVGAPLAAREFEHGTLRLAWIQGITRVRWILTKTLLLSAAALLTGAVLAAVAMWWRQPFDNIDGRISPASFDVEGLVVPAYAVFAFASGVLAGVLLRRTLPAMSLALGLFVGARIGVETLLRPHYLAPHHRAADGLTQIARSHDWVLQNKLVDSVGRQISTTREDIAIVHAQLARVDPHDYLLSLGWKRVITYQPDARFWTFQAIEAAIFLGLAGVAIAVSVALVRRAQA